MIPPAIIDRKLLTAYEVLNCSDDGKSDDWKTLRDNFRSEKMGRLHSTDQNEKINLSQNCIFGVEVCNFLSVS